MLKCAKPVQSAQLGQGRVVPRMALNEVCAVAAPFEVLQGGAHLLQGESVAQERADLFGVEATVNGSHGNLQ